jgi:phage-related protein (TIGR01555 family)
MSTAKTAKGHRSRNRLQNMTTVGSGQGAQGDRTAQQSVPFYSNNPETFTNPLQRWREYCLMWQTSWEARKIVSIPVDDSLRKPFILKGISEQSSKTLQAAFKRLQLTTILKRSLKLERLLGGCLTFMGLDSDTEDASEKYHPRRHKAKLRFLNAIPISRISRMNWDTNPLSENYMRPDVFFVNNEQVHVSRCLLWDGEPLFDPNDFALTNYRANLAGFGNSVFGCLFDDIIFACGSRQAAFQLIQINNAIIAAVSDLQDLSGTPAGQKNLQRVRDIANNLSAYRAAVVDGEKVQLSNLSSSFGSVPELLMTYLQVLSAASDIPASRFLSQAPGGLSTDDRAGLENYYNKIDAFQHERITPQLLRLCDVIGYTEISTWDQERDTLEIEWPPLWNETAKEQAERASLTIDNVLKLVDSALMGDEQAVEEINLRGILSVRLEKDDLEVLRDAQDMIDGAIGNGKEEPDAKGQIERLKNMGIEASIAKVAERMKVNLALIPQDQIVAGARHETEHNDVFSWDSVDDREQAIGTALDHLKEDPDYYRKLKRIENRLPSEAAALLAGRTEPTAAQIAAGNYTKGHARLHGLDIAIENPKGSVRRGRDPQTLKTWEVTMPYHYGYVKRTEGADGDHVDICIGPNESSELVFVIDQTDLATGVFDEHKCICGCDSLAQAQALYCEGFSDGKGKQRIGHISPMHVTEFKKWLEEGDTSQPYRREK